MTGDRYVLLGLARPRAEWFRTVGRWATTAALPAEFLKCVSAVELRARLASGRAHSAVVLDGGVTSVDRDLIQAARDVGCVVFVVDDGDRSRAWVDLGAAAVLPSTFGRELLLDALVTHASMVGRATFSVPEPDEEGGTAAPWQGSLAAVCGPGGTGASTTAAALAQGLGHLADSPGPVVLADFALHAEQAMLHDVRDVVPGVQELVEAHRNGRPGAEDVQALTFEVVERRYALLLGLRRSRYWSTVRPRAFRAALDSLRSSFATVVADVTADFEGEDDAGSTEVEDRNLMARSVVQSADVVFAVGRPGVKGVHALVRVLADLAAAGVPAGRVVPVFAKAPRSPKGRAELSAAVAQLASPAMGGGATAPPIFLPARRVEEALRDAVRLPTPLPATLAGAFRATVDRLGPTVASNAYEAERVRPGSLGTWSGPDSGDGDVDDRDRNTNDGEPT